MFFILIDDYRRNAAIDFINRLNIHSPWSVEIREYRKNRSKSQNRLYWSWLKIISSHTGYTEDELHEEFKVRFLGTEEKTVWGKTLIQPISTTVLNTKAFSNYLNEIEQTVMNIGITLYHPDDYHYAMMNESAQTPGSTTHPVMRG